MAYTTVNKSTANFNTKLWAGNGSSQALTGVGHQTDMVWIKSRTDTRKHNLYDVVRGVQKRIVPNDTVAEDTVPGVTAFGTDGFTVGSETDTNGGSRNFVGWSWKANGAGSSNSDATGSYPITSTVSANTTAGFSIVKYTGNGYSTATIGHGLGSKPAMVIMRPLGYTGAWWIIHKDLTADHVLEFNTNVEANISSFGGGGLKYSTFTNAVIGGGNGSSNSDLWNKSGEDYIAYCFAEKTGYSKFGKYTGNGNSGNGVFINTGFKPSWILIKTTSLAGNNWQMYDNKREGYNPQNDLFRANATDAEGNGTDPIDILSNGFKLYNAAGSANQNGGTYIYMAFGQSLVGSNNIPCTAR